MEKIVWVTKVVSRNFISDFGEGLKNIMGGRLKNYERMLDKTLNEVTGEFYNKYPFNKVISKR